MLSRRNTLSGLLNVIGAALLTSQRSWADFTPPRPPSLPGLYRAPSGVHPFVFASAESMQRLLSSRSPNAAKALATLEQRVRSTLKDPSKVPAPTTGCNLNDYLQGLTYENGGAARTAAELASYANLANLGQSYGDRALADQAGSIARAILMGWAASSLRDSFGRMMDVAEFCDAKGASTEDTRFSVGLHIARGMPFWVHAQDMLLGLDLLDSKDKRSLNSFLSSISGLLRNAANYRAQGSNLDCNRFSNHVSIQLAGIIAIARLLGDRKGMEDAAFGAQGGLLIPWTTQVATTIYGTHATVLNCYRTNDSDHSQLPTAQLGEMMDRYRAHDNQTLGYPMLSLTHLLMAGHIISDAGYHAFGPIAGRQNPMQSALSYYAPLFVKDLSVDQARVAADASRPDVSQYANKIISGSNGATIEGKDGLLLPYLLGATAFPNDDAVRSVIAKAESFAPRYIAFGGVSGLYLGILARTF